jgi:DNA polymerase-3 subunit epsilon
MREVVLDTETTGLSARDGDRVVEIGCVELINLVPTGEFYQTYVNPQRDMPIAAFKVHGLSVEFLQDHPTFSEVVDRFMDFVSDSQLVIHNAQFDRGFLNAELERLGKPELKNNFVDTVSMARKKFPGTHANLDALCRRFGVDNAAREKHGALLDAELLSEVYIELSGGRQPGLHLNIDDTKVVSTHGSSRLRPARKFVPEEGELVAHEMFLDTIKKPIWRE